MLAIWWRLDDVSKDDGVIQFDVVTPDELSTLEVMFEEWLLGCNCFLRVDLGLRPLAIVEVNGKPVLGNRLFLDTRILGVSVDRPHENFWPSTARSLLCRH